MEFVKTNTPEEAGVSSEAILKFFLECDAIGAENHSLLIFKDGKLAFENYTAPYGADIPHFMFSVTKSFVGAALGFAVEEGLLSLSDKVSKFFPEDKEAFDEDERLAKITVEDLSNMNSGKVYSFARKLSFVNYKDVWVKERFREVEDGEETFYYSNNDAHMVAEIVTRVSGMDLLDYLMPRLFEPLGIERPKWEDTVSGCRNGGLGLYLKSRDLMKFGICCLNGGVFDGQQIIPKAWLDLATVKVWNGEDGHGYGHLFWFHDNGYEAEGLMGQLCTVFPNHNSVIVVTGMALYQHEMKEAFFRAFPAAFTEKGDEAAIEKLQDRLQQNSVFEVKKSEKISPLQAKIDGKTYKIKKKFALAEKIGFPMSMLPFTLTMVQAKKPSKSISEATVTFFDGYANLSWKEGDEKCTVKCGTEGKLLESEITLATYTYTMLCSCAWTADNVLEFNIFPINTLSRRFLKIEFLDEDGEKIKIYPTSSCGMDVFAISHAERGGIKSDNAFINDKIQKLVAWVGSKCVPTLKAKAK